MTKIALLGSTGSIGTSTLDVVRRNPDRYRIDSLVAGWNVKRLVEQIAEFHPRVAVVPDENVLHSLRQELRANGIQEPELDFGPKARVAAAAAPEADFVMSAIVGVAGLEATYRAVNLGKRVGLANKEVLVASGKLVMEAARASHSELIPVDSEHNGAHQCLRAGLKNEVTRLILTASGGPFRQTPIADLANVTPAQALNHPTWKMGQRITIDSATMMNKGFEVIEACWLFDLPTTQVDVVVHPQSSIHAMVEYNDGSVIAQVSVTDMRMPIQYALTYPERGSAPVPRMDWSAPRTWNFFPPDFEKFPLLRLAYRCQEIGGTATATLNAADEIAVEAFLNEQIPFLTIAAVVEETLAKVPVRTAGSVEDVLAVDQESRRVAREIVAARSEKTSTQTVLQA